MIETKILPTLENLKQQAKALRAELQRDGMAISHSACLEKLSHQHGFKDWNALAAAAGNQKIAFPFSVGDRVSGTYLAQAFQGEVRGIEQSSPPDQFRISLEFDEAVDVVTFEGMTNFRKRVRCVIGADGKSFDKTSDGKPHLVIDL